MRYLYKYPQSEYPYNDLLSTNRQRDRRAPEYELIDTGVFDQDRYFDVFVEYAKALPEDILIKITILNHAAEPAKLHVLPTLWFRNTWSWKSSVAKPGLYLADSPGPRSVVATHETFGSRCLHFEGDPELLFTENETNNHRSRTCSDRTGPSRRSHQPVRGFRPREAAHCGRTRQCCPGRETRPRRRYGRCGLCD